MAAPDPAPGEPPPATRAPARIARLDSAVVDRIAAGEVVQRPVSALKEMLENSLDAGATHITVTIKDGGFKLLQVADDGCGIEPADLPLLCERHATSKLASFDDLSRLTTLGFRGEALASLSHVAHVSVTTATAGAPVGLRASYTVGGALAGPPARVATAGAGTTVCVEDLFFNAPARRKALASPSDEAARIVDLVARYAAHRAGVAFALRRQGAVKPDVLTRGGADTTRLDALRAVYGAPLARALLPFEFREGGGGQEAAGGGGGGDGTAASLAAAPASFAATGFVASPDFAARRPAFILFVNGRPVESGPLKRTVDAAFTAAAPRGAKPFVFLDLTLPPSHVDANVHPTKREVAFLHADAVASSLADAVDGALRRCDAARTYTQALLPGAGPPARATGGTTSSAPAAATASQAGGGDASTARDRAGGDHKLVRVDATAQTLHRFVAPVPVAVAAAAAAAPAPPRRGGRDAGRAAAAATTLAAPPPPPPPLPPPATRLASVARLLAAADADAHPGLAESLGRATWVGALDADRALAQSGPSLLLLHLTPLARDAARQQALRRVDAPVTVALDPAPAVAELIELALMEEAAANGDGGAAKTGGAADAATTTTTTTTPAQTAEAAALAARLLTLKAGPLGDHLGVDVSPDGRLTRVPAVLDGATPAADRLPALALALARDVDYGREAAFFDTAASALAAFAVGGGEGAGGAGGAASAARAHPPADAAREWEMEHVLLPAVRARLAPPRARARDGSVVELTRLERLYRVFERC